MLFVVRCLLCAVIRLVAAVCCVLLIVWCLLFAVYRLSIVVRCLLFVVVCVKMFDVC